MAYSQSPTQLETLRSKVADKKLDLLMLFDVAEFVNYFRFNPILTTHSCIGLVPPIGGTKEAAILHNLRADRASVEATADFNVIRVGVVYEDEAAIRKLIEFILVQDELSKWHDQLNPIREKKQFRLPGDLIDVLLSEAKYSDHHFVAEQIRANRLLDWKEGLIDYLLKNPALASWHEELRRIQDGLIPISPPGQQLRIGVDYISWKDKEVLASLLPIAEIIDATDIVDESKAVLDRHQIEASIIAGDISQEGLRVIKDYMKKGEVTAGEAAEEAVAAMMRYRRSKGYLDGSIAGIGARNSPHLHGIQAAVRLPENGKVYFGPSQERKPEPGERWAVYIFVTVDGEYVELEFEDCYKETSQEQQQIYKFIKDLQYRFEEEIKPGITYGEAYDWGMEEFTKAGYRNRPFRAGHSMGPFLHGPLSIAPGNKVRIVPGHKSTWEPRPKAKEVGAVFSRSLLMTDKGPFALNNFDCKRKVPEKITVNGEVYDILKILHRGK
jgi:Xaa-Pro aminopeptidase